MPRRIVGWVALVLWTSQIGWAQEFRLEEHAVSYVAWTTGAFGYDFGADGTEGMQTSDGHIGERTLLTRVEPEYPETLKRLSIGGSVRLAVSISPKGTVEKVVLLGGNPVLAEAAIKAVKQWVYAPGPSRTTVEVTVRFGGHR